MTKSIATLVAAAFATSLSFGALAADDAKAARKQANDEYKAARKACEPMKGKEEKACKEEAKAKHDQKIAEIKSSQKAAKGKSPSSGATSAPAAPAGK